MALGVIGSANRHCGRSLGGKLFPRNGNPVHFIGLGFLRSNASPPTEGAFHCVAWSAHLAPREVPSPPVTERPRLPEGEQSDLDCAATSPVDAVQQEIPDPTHLRQPMNGIAEPALLRPRQPGESYEPVKRP